MALKHQNIFSVWHILPNSNKISSPMQVKILHGHDDNSNLIIHAWGLKYYLVITINYRIHDNEN